MLPLRFLNRVSRFSRLLWRKVDEFRFARKDEWDGRIFMPLDAWRQMLTSEFPEISPENRDQAMCAFSVAAAWRPGQDIVRFDSDFQNMLCKTRFMGKLPSDYLARLPAWCIYFDTGPLEFNGVPTRGFFASLEENRKRDFFYLRLTFLGEKICYPVLLPLGDWTLERALELSHNLVNQNRLAKNLPAETHGPHVDDGLYSALNMVLFVCSNAMERGDVNHFTYPPAIRVRKKGWRIFPPAQPKLHLMGKTAGERFRQFMTLERKKRGVVPHIRRAHWHGFWHGPMKGERAFRLRWLSPIPVNMKEELEENSSMAG